MLNSTCRAILVCKILQNMNFDGLTFLTALVLSRSREKEVGKEVESSPYSRSSGWLRLVFPPTLFSCSSRFLRALQQNRAQSRLLYLLILLSSRPCVENLEKLFRWTIQLICYHSTAMINMASTPKLNFKLYSPNNNHRMTVKKKKRAVSITQGSLVRWVVHVFINSEIVLKFTCTV